MHLLKRNEARRPDAYPLLLNVLTCIKPRLPYPTFPRQDAA